MEVIQTPPCPNLFKPSNWLIKIDFIEQLLLNNTLVAVFTDEKGGKTSFSHVLGSELDDSFNFIAINARKELDISEIQVKITSQFPTEIALSTFTALISAINEQKKHFLLLIDDAHLLDITVIEELLHALCTYDHSNFFHVCLVGNQSLNNALYQLALQRFKNKIHTISLGNLSQRETRTYLLKKLHAYNPESRISDEDLKKFYDLTKGNISQINSQFPVYFKNKLQPKRHFKAVIRLLAISIGCLLLFLSGKYLWEHRPSLPKVKFVYRVGPSFLAKIPEKALISVICPYNLGAKRLAIQPSPFNRIVEIEEDPEEFLEKFAIVDRVVSIPKTMHRTIEGPQGRPIPLDEPLLDSSLASIGPLQPKEEGTPLYTIQILASLNEEDINFYLRRYPDLPYIKKQVAQRGGKDWFVLTSGHYQAFTEAAKALKELPPKLRKEGAWVRSVNELKNIG